MGLAESAVRSLALVAALTIGACDSDSPDVAAPITTYTVSFDLEATEGPLGALQFDVEYRGAGRAAWVEAGCRWIVQAAIHACNARRDGVMTCAVVDTGGFTGPIPLLECELITSDDAVTRDDFSIRVTDASSPYLQPVDAEVNVSSIVVAPPNTTTTTDPDNPPTVYDVVLEIGDDRDPLSITRLELDISHDGVVGGWVGSGYEVDCRWLVATDTRVCNEASNRLLTCVAFSAPGFGGSQPILECGFATYEEIVDTSDFAGRVNEISTVDGQVPDYVHVSVASVAPR